MFRGFEQLSGSIGKRVLAVQSSENFNKESGARGT